MIFIFRFYVNKTLYKYQENPVYSVLKKNRNTTLTFQPITVFCPLKIFLLQISHISVFEFLDCSCIETSSNDTVIFEQIFFYIVSNGPVLSSYSTNG